jgi:stringent starvation protein B
MTSAVDSKRPYLLRAMHEWMSDNGLTPHVVVDVNFPHANLPSEHISEGRMILNVSYQATQDLTLSNERLDFEARFSGEPRRISIPMDNVLGIYARETGQGMIFTDDDSGDDSPPDGSGDERPRLRVVK